MSARPGFYLLDHPPRRAQFRFPRRQILSGVAVVHTFEGLFHDASIDTGAERGAPIISNRTDGAGSYHELFDSDSAVPLVPDNYESFQVGVGGHNQHAWGGSFTCRTTDLHPSSGWTHRAMVIAGSRIRAFWARNGFCVTHSARWVTNAQVAALRVRHEHCSHGLKVGGLTTHGQLQPADRSDAWTRHPFRGDLERMLVAAITNTTPAPEEEEDMPTVYQIALHEGRGELWKLWGPPNEPPNDLGYLRDNNDVAVSTSIFGAHPMGPQGQLIDYLLEMRQKKRPGAGAQVLRLSDLDVTKVAEGIAYILALDGRPDAQAHAKATADELHRRLAA